MQRLKKMTRLVKAMPDGAKKKAMQSALKVIENIDKAQADYDGLSNVERKELSPSTRIFFCDTQFLH